MRHARLFAIVCLAGCGPPSLLSLGERPLTATPSDAVPLEVVTRATAVRDPLPISGTHVQVSGLEEALGHAISTATAARPPREGSDWQLTVELIGADARLRGGRLSVALNARATLRTRSGRRYLAQTHAHCKQAAIANAAEGAPVFYSCMTQLGRDLSDWLAGM